MKAFLYQDGTQVRIKRGIFPMESDLIGRTGVVVETDDYRPERYGVVLDGESLIRDFSQDELEPIETP